MMVDYLLPLALEFLVICSDDSAGVTGLHRDHSDEEPGCHQEQGQADQGGGAKAGGSFAHTPVYRA